MSVSADLHALCVGSRELKVWYVVTGLRGQKSDYFLDPTRTGCHDSDRLAPPDKKDYFLVNEAVSSHVKNSAPAVLSTSSLAIRCPRFVVFSLKKKSHWSGSSELDFQQYQQVGAPAQFSTKQNQVLQA